MKNFLFAVQFLTVLPVRRGQTDSPDVPMAVLWFPVVGALIGLALCGAYYLMHAAFGVTVADVAVICLLVAITGALHLDGFADAVDGIFGGKDKESRLRIMRDSCVGSFGAVGLICLLGIKFAAFHNLPGFKTKILALVLMTALGRWAQVVSASVSNYARSEKGVGEIIVNGTGRTDALLASAVPFALAATLFFWQGLIVFAAVVCITLLVTRWVKAKISGVTGDTLGAVSEVAEVVVLLCLVALV